jgi:hypothetical protein
MLVCVQLRSSINHISAKSCDSIRVVLKGDILLVEFLVNLATWLPWLSDIWRSLNLLLLLKKRQAIILIVLVYLLLVKHLGILTVSKRCCLTPQEVSSCMVELLEEHLIIALFKLQPHL